MHVFGLDIELQSKKKELIKIITIGKLLKMDSVHNKHLIISNFQFMYGVITLEQVILWCAKCIFAIVVINLDEKPTTTTNQLTSKTYTNLCTENFLHIAVYAEYELCIVI